VGSKCLALNEGIKHAKKHVWLSIEIHVGIFGIFGIKIKYSYTIICDCEKSPLTHDYLLFIFSIFFT
jgi:hypothetical protein